MRMVYYIKEDKAAVQDFYADVICKGLEKAGYPKYKIISSKEIDCIDKKSIIISISHYLTVRLWLKGFKNIVYWVQGSSPDESYMRNHSRFRRFIISVIERIALAKAKFVFMVSKSMQDYYKKKYKIDFSGKTYIMPCYNSNIRKELFSTQDKYENNVFCYVGGLSVWQCFPETVDLYKQIEDKVPTALFRVFTGDKEKAITILKEKNVKNYEVKYVMPDKLVEELASCKYGFIVRAESPVNYVATPTKLSNYMAAGLVPIVSNTVGFFNEILGDAKNAIVLNGNRELDRIVELTNKTIKAEDVLNEYTILFNKFYNTEEHSNNIANMLKNVKL